MRSRIFTTLLLASLWLSGCSLEIEVTDISSEVNDFLNSRILSETEGISDGITDLIIVIELQNSTGTLVADYTPMFSVDSGTATFLSCTKSTAEGISTCRFRSNVSGTVNVSAGNIGISLTEEIVFMPPDRNGTFMQIVSSAQNNTNAGGYSVTSHIGAPVQGLRQVVDGYEIFINTTGAITPTED